jgi:hypothetical protein
VNLPDRSPLRLDRAALERVLQRAAELQASESDLGEELTESEILALGREVGLPPRHLQRALLEERTRGSMTLGDGWLDRVVGQSELAVARVVQSDRETIEHRLLHWFQHEEVFVLQRRTTDRISWEPHRGVGGALRRSRALFHSGRTPPMLDRAASVTADMSDLESGYVHVLLTAVMRRLRAGYIGGSAAAASTPVAGRAVLFTLGAFAPVALAPLALGVGLGWGISRQYRPSLERTRMGLERVLDALEVGSTRRAVSAQPTPSLLGMVSQEIQRALRAPRSGGPE